MSLAAVCSSFTVALVALFCWLSTCAIATAQSECPPLAHAGSRAFSCRFDATLTRMFTPRTVPSGTYRVYVTDARIENVVAQFRAVASSSNVEGAWVVHVMDPLDAYGDSGLYDRARVARLYVGVRAQVARGPVIEHGRTVASITLVSPYPNASLTALERGTLIIEFKISRE
jgi:hypothetical protein